MKHTLESLITLSQSPEGIQQIRVMVAELDGWDGIFKDDDGEYCGHQPKAQRSTEWIPNKVLANYPEDLNAVHKMELKLGTEYPTHDREYFRKQLRKIFNGPPHAHEVHATALQRSIALILTLQ